MYQKNLAGLFSSLMVGMLLSASGCTSTEKNKEETSMLSPNIVYILADDLGYGDVSAYNPTSKIPTPHIDRLAAEGMRFTDAHSPSSVCTPTRYGILTGRYCWRSRLPQGVLRGYGRALIDKERTTVASFLQQHGYHTGVVGKWHLGLDWILKEGHEQAMEAASTSVNGLGIVTEMDPQHIDFSKQPENGPLDRGFTYSFILPASLDMDPYCYLENDELLAVPSDSTPGNDLNTGYTEAFWRAGRIAPGFEFDQVLPTFTNKAVSYIEERSTSKQPFFLYIPFAAPHTPWVPTQEFQGIGEAGTYGAFVNQVDASVGRILTAIEESGLEDNTLVFFTSDNGPFWTPELIEQYSHRAAGTLRGMKADAWEGGHRIPFIVKYPGQVAPGSKSDAIITLTNLLATCADLLNVELEPDEGEDSFSILPILKGQTNAIADQEAVVHHSSRGFFAIRKGDWKLILGRGSGGFSQPQVYEPKKGEVPGQLYHLKEDLQEANNVYSDHPDVVRDLTSILERYQLEGRSR